MTFLPIVERELRVAARRAATHWTRLCAALATLTLWLLGFGIDLVLGLRAQWRLQRRFREIASGSLSKEVKAQRADTTAALGFGHRPLNSAQP